jgi:DASS family divalent anion:Na+ symporter
MAEMVSTAAAPAPGPSPMVAATRGSKRSRGIGLVLALVVGLGIWALPTPHGLPHIGHLVLAITLFTVVLWVFEVLNNGISAILMMGLMIAAGVKPGSVLSAFSGGAFWILLCVLFYGLAMRKTGLAQRLSYYIIAAFPASYAGIQSAFLVVGLLLSLAIPSNTVRAAIMVPIAWSLTKALGLPGRSKGSALIMLTATEMSFIPGNTWMYGSLLGPVVEQIFRSKHLPISWVSFAEVCAVPNLAICILLIFVNSWLFKPEAPLSVGHGFVKTSLKAMGKLKRDEWITAIIVAASVVFWATAGHLHNMPSFLVGMIAVAVLGVTGIIKDSEIGPGIPWMLIIFIGGCIGLGTVVNEVKITDWLALYMVPVTQHFTFSTAVLLMVVVLAMFVLRFLDTTGWIAFTVLFLPLCDVLIKAGVPPLVLMAALVLSNTPFWIPYQNAWIAIGEGITAGEAFSPKQRAKSATAYAVIVLVVVALSVVYWKMIHVL